MFKFINNEINESRLFRSNSALKRYNAYEIKNVSFIYFLALTAMKESFDSAPWTQDYIKRTFRRGPNFSTVNRSDTDLYWTLYIIENEKSDMLDDKQKEQNELELNKIDINKQLMLQWARHNARGRGTIEQDRRFLMNLEKTLHIDNSDYRSMRRLISNWNMLTDEQRKIVCTRLLFAMRRHLRMSEIYPQFEKFVKNSNYLIKDADDPEKPGSNVMSNVLKGVAVGAGIAGLGTAMSIRKASDDIKSFRERLRSYFKENVTEMTTSASVATMVLPIGSEIQKRPNQYRVKRGSRKRKK